MPRTAFRKRHSAVLLLRRAAAGRRPAAILPAPAATLFRGGAGRYASISASSAKALMAKWSQAGSRPKQNRVMDPVKRGAGPPQARLSMSCNAPYRLADMKDWPAQHHLPHPLQTWLLAQARGDGVKRAGARQERVAVQCKQTLSKRLGKVTPERHRLLVAVRSRQPVWEWRRLAKLRRQRHHFLHQLDIGWRGPPSGSSPTCIALPRRIAASPDRCRRSRLKAETVTAVSRCPRSSRDRRVERAFGRAAQRAGRRPRNRT